MNKALWVLVLMALLSFLLFGGERLPNDPLLRLQHGFRNPGGNLTVETYSYRPSARAYPAVQGIDPAFTRAWKVTTGSKNVVVALLDDGFYCDHEDIRDNIWENAGKTGLDDDGNGIVDDVMGLDFVFDGPDCHIFDGMDPTRIQP